MKAVLREGGGEALLVADGQGFSPPRRDQQASPLIALHVEGLSKRYGTTEAVAGLSFDIAQGEVFGLLGPNGAGKTTTIAMLATQRWPSGGDATLFGHSVCTEPRAVRQMIGLAPPGNRPLPRVDRGGKFAIFWAYLWSEGAQSHRSR